VGTVDMHVLSNAPRITLARRCDGVDFTTAKKDPPDRLRCFNQRQAISTVLTGRRLTLKPEEDIASALALINSR
jgi:hypothetical protein